MKIKTKIILIIGSILFFTACSTHNREIPKKSPCACKYCDYDVIKVN
ncbi:hypothetical protein [Campylobacter volucris]|nr:hypothetical protein [Campylobacter volucris]MBF7049635.1 hypothetical protein [Campylobacter volucris]HED1004881.1 hypothetical protein [Campylobacter jejuni]